MRTLVIICLTGWMALSGLASLRAGTPETNASSTQLTIPYVPTRHDVVGDLLWLAGVGTNDVVYDLGSGDGRILTAAVRDCGVRKAVGIEIDPQRVRESRENARKAGVTDRVEFIQGDLFTNDFSQASVVVLYLSHLANLDLRPKLVQTLKPGTRVVSHQFGMGEWPPEKELRVRTTYLGMFGRMFNPFASNPNVPDFEGNRDPATTDTLSLWIVPAPVAGVWRGKVLAADGERGLKLELHQRLAGVSGSFEVHGPTNLQGYIRGDLWGSHFRCEGRDPDGPYGEFNLMFDGRAHGDVMKGKFAIIERGRVQERQWEGRRDKADFTGTWEWIGPNRVAAGATEG